MLLPILKYPDPRLRLKAKAVSVVTPELQTLAQNLLETMYHSRGIGLAAPQVGESVRLIVIDTRPRNDDGHVDFPKVEEEMTELERQIEQPLILFNPQVVKQERQSLWEEGCLSVPTFYETVQRAEYVEVEAINLQGQKILIKTDGLLAICLQHEGDHLDGKLFIDRLSLIKSNRIKNRIKKTGYPELQST